jgi:nitrous oxidase accessory protein NosD
MVIKRIFISLISCIIIVNIITNFQIYEFANGKILYVGGSGDGNYSIIQDTINISDIGDIIFVYNGIYNENIEINKSISIIGENKDSTIINGKKSNYVLMLKAPNINISGFTIKDGLISGILIERSENCKIFQNIIDRNVIGINVISSNYTIIFNNTISNNTDVGVNITNNKEPSYFLRYNTIFHNNFISNKQNAYDGGISNNWSYQNEGNYYDDYIGQDKNNDGIGDKAYFIPGGENIDNYPLMMPYNGNIRLKEFYVDDESLYTMLIIGMVVAILFLLPVAYIWYRKTKHLK